MSSTQDDIDLAAALADFTGDPLGFVMFAYPWGEPGPLERETGPDTWQREVLESIGRKVRAQAFDGFTPVLPVREAAVSGHGSGKSALCGWLTNWIASTRPNSKGTITASTAPQLETKTWPEIAKWTKLSCTAHWFEITMGRGSMKLVAKENPDGWRVTAITSREENSESFAGQHAADSSSWYIFDEASAVPVAIWDVAEGGLTDGEPFFFAFGNGTRNTGRFHEIFHGKIRSRWGRHHVDARLAKKPNKALHAQWIEDRGIDSDFVKVRVLGQFPSLGAMQWIGADVIAAARERPTLEDRTQRMVIAVDVARGGGADSVIARRRGLDARSWPWVRLNTRDTMVLVGKIVELYNQHVSLHDDPVIMIDATGLGGPVYDRLQQMGVYVLPCVFSGASSDPQYSNHRTEIWGKMRDWLRFGSIPDDQLLADDLAGPEYGYNKKDQFLLESKDEMELRGIASPDAGDALAISFSVPMAPRDFARSQDSQKVKTMYDPLG